MHCGGEDNAIGLTVSRIKLETGQRPYSAGIPYILLLRMEAIGVSNFWASTVGSELRAFGSELGSGLGVAKGLCGFAAAWLAVAGL